MGGILHAGGFGNSVREIIWEASDGVLSLTEVDNCRELIDSRVLLRFGGKTLFWDRFFAA